MPRLPLIALLLAVPSFACAQDDFYLKDGEKVVFLGDSNTFAGGYIVYLDAYLATRFPDKHFELINVGLPSETVSGLSEPDHPFPRPDAHERLDRVLSRTKPDVVVACYGMNDGIYYPFSAERFDKHKEGMRRLIDKAQQAGARVTLVTTPPFDPVPVATKLLPAGAEKYSWVTPFKDYDDVLSRYSAWLVGLRKEGFVVADAHTAVNRHLQQMRKADPDYRLAGDGIHPNATGHWLIAAEILKAWHAPAVVEAAEIDLTRPAVPNSKLVSGSGRAVRGFAIENGTLTLTWRPRVPLPVDSQWPREFPERDELWHALNQYTLTVKGAAAKQYDLFEGETKLARVTAGQLSKGLDLTAFDNLSSNRQAQEILKLAGRRQQILGRAWLTHIGHKRPGTPEGMPLEKAQKQAADLETQIRRLARPSDMTLTLGPVAG